MSAPVVIKTPGCLICPCKDMREKEYVTAAYMPKYARSIDAADLNLASEIWLNSPEVTFIHPRGHERGFEEVKYGFYIGTMGNRFSERRLNIFNVAVQVYGDTAIAEFYWYFIF